MDCKWQTDETYQSHQKRTLTKLYFKWFIVTEDYLGPDMEDISPVRGWSFQQLLLQRACNYTMKILVKGKIQPGLNFPARFELTALELLAWPNRLKKISWKCSQISAQAEIWTLACKIIISISKFHLGCHLRNSFLPTYSVGYRLKLFM